LKFIIRNIGKGCKTALIRVYKLNNSGNIAETYVNKQEIERELSCYNKQHYQKAFSALICNDKIYNEIKNDSTRNKIINGGIIREECDSDEVYEFLKLLQNPALTDRHFEPITKEEWTKVVKAAKKTSTSSIYSKCTYAVYRCALENE
jgi:hypothetical protein